MSDLLPRESRQLNRKVASILHKGGSIGRDADDARILSQFCSQNTLIKQFPESAFENFTKNMAIQTFIEDEVLFYQGQSISDDSYFYILLSGKLALFIYHMSLLLGSPKLMKKMMKKNKINLSGRVVEAHILT